ncbi:MAG: hypothetical protein IPG53_11715 [Ignavibacteriales bacterium]|nr:hypothetical protein [Ignavibacteriales bacterium]
MQKLEAQAALYLIQETQPEVQAPAPKVVDDMVLSNRRLTVLLEISRSLTSITDLDELLSHIIKMAAEVLQVERATLFIHDKNEKSFGHEPVLA